MRKELEIIILKHKEKYPLMQIEDFIKLIYQNEFGGGHLITNKNDSLKFLIEEFNNIKDYSESLKIEEIGNNIIRVPLTLIPKLGLSLKEFNDVFVESCNKIVGNNNNYIEKLKILQNMTKYHTFNFSSDELNIFIENHIKLGCPMISHSLLYKEAYNPSYRIIRKEKLEDLTACKKMKIIV